MLLLFGLHIVCVRVSQSSQVCLSVMGKPPPKIPLAIVKHQYFLYDDILCHRNTWVNFSSSTRVAGLVSCAEPLTMGVASSGAASVELDAEVKLWIPDKPFFLDEPDQT